MRALLVLLLAAPSVSLGAKTVEQRTAERVRQYGEKVRKSLGPAFAAAGVAYPPGKLLLLGLKTERRLEMYAAGADNKFKFIRSYPFTAASGVIGPKLREGDLQVPEGVYRVESLNPDSRFHLALKVGYPNEFERKQGERDGRSNLGGLIMIHGNQVSIGCIAIGDKNIEEVFIAMAETGRQNGIIMISPVDPRRRAMPEPRPAWMSQVYRQLARDVKLLLPLPPDGALAGR